MNWEQFYEYILNNFNVSGEYGRLLSNILLYAEAQGFVGEDLYHFLCSLLDGTIGLSDKEIRMADF